MSFLTWLKELWARIDRKIYENRPIEEVAHVTEDQFEEVAKKGGIKPSSARVLASYSLFAGEPVKVGKKRYQVITNH